MVKLLKMCFVGDSIGVKLSCFGCGMWFVMIWLSYVCVLGLVMWNLLKFCILLMLIVVLMLWILVWVVLKVFEWWKFGVL